MKCIICGKKGFIDWHALMAHLIFEHPDNKKSPKRATK